ncbi:hypothetical protein AVEN_216152-1 [Araneus ventricosus]|uniref:Uncharacterized protein n=1 Tax=Araneus ventricosus TaxID=182803 RepID=A0A4Y2I9G7_ARAVE|nr:hypothetical protein AVEN_216152-1 [Araneus ventricosus]
MRNPFVVETMRAAHPPKEEINSSFVSRRSGGINLPKDQRRLIPFNEIRARFRCWCDLRKERRENCPISFNSDSSGFVAAKTRDGLHGRAI